MAALVQFSGGRFANTSGDPAAGTLYPGWPPADPILTPSRIIAPPPATWTGDAALTVTTDTSATSGTLGQSATAAVTVTTLAYTGATGTTLPVLAEGRSTGNSGTATATSFATSWPAGYTPVTGHTALLFGHVSATSLTMGTPTGWTLLPGPTWPVNEGANSRVYGWYRELVAGDTAPTITNSGSVTGGWDIVVLSGTKTGAPIGQVGTSTGSGTSLALPSLTGALAASELVASVHARVLSSVIPTDIVPDPAYGELADHATTRLTSNANVRMETAVRPLTANGTYGGETFSIANGISSSLIAVLVEILAAPSSVTQTGSASLTVTTTPTTGVTVAWVSTAALTVTTSSTTDASLGAVSTAALTVTTTTTTVGLRTQFGTASLTITTSVTAAGGATVLADASLTVTTSTTTVGLTGSNVSLTITTTTTVVAVRSVTATAGLTITTSITAIGRLGAVSTAALTVLTTVTLAALVTLRSTAALTITTTITASATVTGPLVVIVTGQVTVSSGTSTTQAWENASSAAVTGGRSTATVIGDGALSRVV